MTFVVSQYPPLVVKQPCGIARLLAEIYQLPVSDMFMLVGLELCPRCDEPAKDPKFYPYCGTQHKGRAKGSRIMTLICEECGKSFERNETQVVNRLVKKGYNHIWCGKPCQGKWYGRTVGIHNLGPRKLQSHCKRGHELVQGNLYIAPSGHRSCRACSHIRYANKCLQFPNYKPRPRQAGTGYKHNWLAIWEAHLETGFGGRRLSRLLSIPEQTIANVLRYYRARNST